MSALFNISSRLCNALLVLLILLLVTGCGGSKSTKEPIKPARRQPIERSSDFQRYNAFDQDLSHLRSEKKRYKRGAHRNAKTVWPRLFSLYALPKVDNARVDRQVQRFTKDLGYLQRTQVRATPYLHAIIEQVEARGIPGEIALLPVVESAFKTNAYSRAKASGLWQFIPSTGKIFGLKQNFWYDGRRDVHAATGAALTYLTKLNRMFDGDWLLALAAYNAGEGRVGRAIKKNIRLGRPTDFWSLDLPRETKDYVPRLLAVARIYRYASYYGLKRKPIPNKPYYKVVNIKGQIDLAMAAELAGVSIEEIYRLNPGYHRWATDPKGPHRLLIPANKSRRFKKQLAKASRNDMMQWRQHTLRDGESVHQIAKIYGISPAMILKVNSLSSRQANSSGKTLMIPVPKRALSHYTGYHKPTTPRRYRARSKKTSRKVRVARGKKSYYKVRPGDSLGSVAKRHSVTTRDLARWNKISHRAHLQKGQKLVIRRGKAPRTATRTRAKKKLYYIVKRGDTLGKVARRYSVSTRKLAKWNGISSRAKVRRGQKLVVFTSKGSTVAKKSRTRGKGKKSFYTVKRGDTLSKIARRYKLSTRQLARINGISSRSTLKRGQKLAVYSSKSKGKTKKKRGALQYTVRKGDTLSNISRRFKVSLTNLRRWNGKKVGKHLKIGQKLKVRI